jgi:hypothetical protein
MPKKKSDHTILWKILLFFTPLFVIFFFSRNVLLKLPNPSWGDMTAMPSMPIPFSQLFYPWQDIYDGIFGGQYMPHFISSYLVGFVPPGVLVYIYLFLLFPIILFSFLDFFKTTLKRTSLFDKESLLYAGVLTLIIYFSNVFLVNFLQGNPDVYYPYLLCIPGVLYLYLFIRFRQVDSILKLSLIITLAMWFGFFALYYMGILLFPFFVLFCVLFMRGKLRRIILLLSVFFIFVLLNNLPYLFMSLKPVLSAVHKVTTGIGSSGLSVDEFFSMYRAINPFNLFYFSGNAGDYTWILFNLPGGYISASNPAFSLLSFQFAMMIAAFIFVAREPDRKKDMRILLYGLLAIFLLLFTIIIIWDTQVFYELARRVPLVPLFRNPKKLVLSLFVSYMIITVFLRFVLPKKIYTLLLFIILILNASAVLPLISDGYNGLENAYKISLRTYGFENSRTLESFQSYAGFPTRYLSLKPLLNNIDKKDNEYHYRIMVLPDNSQQLYGSHLRYLFNPFFISPLQAVWGDLDQRINIMDSFYNTILGKNTADVGNELKIMNVKYLIVDKKSPYYLFSKNAEPKTLSYYGTFTSGDPKAFYKILKNNKAITLVSENNNFYILKVNSFKDNTFFIPQKPCVLQDVKIKSCDFFTTSSTNYKPSQIATVSKQIYTNPTKYYATINVKSPTTTTLFFSQSFDDAWKIYQQGGNKAEIVDHTVGSLFGNAWQLKLPQKGDYRFEIVYTWQKSYEAMVIISLVTVGINSLLLLTFPFWKRKYDVLYEK